MTSGNENYKLKSTVFGYELSSQLIQDSVNGLIDYSLAQLINRILSIDLEELDELKIKESFTEDELKKLVHIVSVEGMGNLEVWTKSLDLVVKADQKLLYNNVVWLYNSYKEIFDLTGDITYLARAIELVKYLKSKFKPRQKEIFDVCMDALKKADFNFFSFPLIRHMISVFDEETYREEIVEFIEERIKDCNTNQKFSLSRKCIEYLRTIGILDMQEERIKLAENYEMEGDGHVSRKKPNIYYPNLSRIFWNGLQAIKTIGGCEELRKRLENKLILEQKCDQEMLKIVGIRYNMKIDLNEIKEIVSRMGIDSFESALNQLLLIPLPPAERFRESSPSENFFYVRSFPKTVKLNAEGFRIASKDTVSARQTWMRQQVRERMIVLIQMIKEKMDSYEPFDLSFIDTLVQSPFIPDDRRDFYKVGLTEGFLNDFVIFSHLIVPQLENSLRHVGNLSGITLRQLSEEIQHESLMGGCIKKLRQSALVDPDLLDELESFLVDGNDVNFRNNLSHGIETSAFFKKYGLYLWWLTLKMLQLK
ncbi:MAG: hypothetical protein QM727_05550 [Niabella sp.]